MTFCKSLIPLLILCWPISLRTPVWQVIIAFSWAFPALLSLMPTSLTLRFRTYSPSLSHLYPCRAILYILCSLIPFLLGGDFPPSVDILHMCPCIEHRYVPLLGTSLFPPMTLVSFESVTIKQFYSFSRFLNIWKSPKKKVEQGNMLSLAAGESCRLRTEHYISHPLVGS